VRVFDMIVAERELAAERLAALTPEQLARPSLCAGWTVHDVGAHLTTFLRFGQAKLYAGIAATAGDIDRINLALTRWAARRPTSDVVRVLRRHARSRTTIPRSGYDPILADLVLHDFDVRLPLGLERAVPEERLRVAFGHLTARPTPGFTMGGRLAGLRVEATDTGWRAGSGPVVRGDAVSVLLAISGRDTAPGTLDGDGVPLLRERLRERPKPSPALRLLTVARVALHPAPPERRSRLATPPR
jgi:uncharacterized protein (TIGR03083 family)